MNCSLVVGQKFNSFENFKLALKNYSETNHVRFFMRQSESLEKAKLRLKRDMHAIEELKYYYVKMCCLYGGRKFVKKPNSHIRKTKTLKQDCEAFIKLRLTEDGQHLQIISINFMHNHGDTTDYFEKRQKRVLKNAKYKELRKQKKEQAAVVLDELKEVITNCPLELFKKRIEMMQSLKRFWKETKEVGDLITSKPTIINLSS